METGQAEAAEAVGQIAVSLKAGLRVCGSAGLMFTLQLQPAANA